MNLSKRIVFTSATVCGLLALSALVAPNVAASVKAALVEITMPSKPFQAHLDVPLDSSPITAGPPTNAGTLAVTSVTITNYNNTDMQIHMFNGIPTSGSCGGTGTLNIGGTPESQVIVPARQTMHLTFPSPWVFTPNSGNSCFAVQTQNVPTSAIQVDVNGYIN